MLPYVSKISQIAPRVRAILIVDDEPDIRETLRDVFEMAVPDVKVFLAKDAGEGRAVLDQNDVDLVLSDYRMPDEDGLSFLMEAKRVAPSVPRILLTAYPDNELAKRSVEDAQVEAFLTKPASLEQLTAVVNAALLKRHNLREAIAKAPAPPERISLD